MAEKVTNLRGYPFKKMLIVGKTGTGKSTLCNRIAGLTHDDALFPVSEGAQSCTQSTAFGHIRFGGNKERLVSLIDTIGFDDPNNDTDVKIIAELVDKLMNNCDKVHLFIIAVNGQAPRLDGSLVAMIKIFQEMFTEEFWDRCCIVFTRVPMDKKQIRLRQKNGGGKTDDQRAKEYMKVVEDKFPQVKNKGLKHLFLDACFDDNDEEEEEAFNKAMEDLYILLDGMTGLETSKVNDKVESEHGKLKRELENREKDKEEFTKQLLAVNDQLKEAEANRSKDESAYKEKIANMEGKMEDLGKRGARRGGGFLSDLVGTIFPPAAPILKALDNLY